MGFDLSIFNDEKLGADYVEWLIDERSVEIQAHFNHLWEYYINRMVEASRAGKVSGRWYLQAQEYGLPARITGLMHSANTGVFGGRAVQEVQRKEVVIENDIAWRINSAVDFLFGKPITFVSKSPDSQKRAEIESILKAVFEANGGIGFFQDMAVLGGVYGFVDCMVRPGDEITQQGSRLLPRLASRDAEAGKAGSHISSSSPNLLHPPPRLASGDAGAGEDVLQLAQTIGLELIEAPRALPVLEEDDYKELRYYIQHFYQSKNALSKRKSSFLSRLLYGGRASGGSREMVAVTEITSAIGWQRYEDKILVAEGELPWGFLPVVHIQNIAQPYYYEGISDVEVLIPLQDELNTRLSDRANRITFQSFKMYLGKGIEGFEDRPVSPGRMWYTDNPDAAIEEFGGDAATPSEDIHIAEIREAMDKTSGVTPLVAGVLKNKLGNLTSAVALKLTLMGMLSKTERKRFTYGEGLKKICMLVLDILDKANVYKTKTSDKQVDIIFPSPLPENVMEKLKEAQIKKELGVPIEQVLRELGYETTNES